eukprot:TRINITY_DN16633_c0_g1_i1.p1 TRINITY_DN16633_c0_g1~~TRINITY_DN16633_c0_g1_i1.p1  ORF type:complete len:199 (+),score=57.78 TRINITY_DN16633_c0_g1_i1:61-597(+)
MCIRDRESGEEGWTKTFDKETFQNFKNIEFIVELQEISDVFLDDDFTVTPTISIEFYATDGTETVGVLNDSGSSEAKGRINAMRWKRFKLEIDNESTEFRVLRKRGPIEIIPENHDNRVVLPRNKWRYGGSFLPLNAEDLAIACTLAKWRDQICVIDFHAKNFGETDGHFPLLSLIHI